MDRLYKNLEFDVICGKVAECASAQPVIDELLETEPTTHISDADKLLRQTSDALYILASRRPDLTFDDILPLIDKARVGAILQPAEFLKIKRNIAALRSLKSCVENADGCDSLKDITAWVRACDDVENDISNAVENETDIKDSASAKLQSLRRAISRANAKLKERLDGYTKKGELAKYLRENIVTIRDGRYVVPVKSECRSSVKGLVHDVSATGATVFIEPFAIVEANNELKTLRTEEQMEIERILTELGQTVAEHATELSEGQRVLTECGVIFAKAEFAKKTDAYRPRLNDCGIIRLTGARHPLIDRGTVVPVDIELDKRILLISGPNTGGKTVVLKTVGLFALMAASGMFLPTTDGSEICIFDKIYCDIGDLQSISQSLSTFSAHIKNIAAIMSEIDGRSLVLLDEVGDGTDPDEGAALAVAIIKKILRSGATAVVTTHFNSVKEFALGKEGILNACMQFDHDNFKPTYRLLGGVSGSSYALEIAERLGLGVDIIDDARSALSNEKIAFDNVMRETEKLRNEILRDRQETERLRTAAENDARSAQKLKADYAEKLDKLNAESRTVIRKRADEYTEYAEELIEELKEQLKAADEAALFNARKTAKKLSVGVPVDVKKPQASNAPASTDELSDGIAVYVSGLDKEGIIVGKPRGNKAVVAIGSIKTELPVSSLSIIRNEKKDVKRSCARETAEPENIEIMMLGLTVDEAVERLERSISDLPSHSTVRVVHGKGTGALGKGIQNYLKRQPRVKSFRYGGYGEGDSGVTIVEIK